MENLQLNDSIGQPYGYVLYETVIFGGGQLHTRDHVRDRAQVGPPWGLTQVGCRQKMGENRKF